MHPVKPSASSLRQIWDRPAIIAELSRRGWSLAGLSARYGYQRTAVSKALTRPWPAVEAIVAEALGVDPQVLWPERYDCEGFPRTGRPQEAILSQRGRRVESARRH